MIAVGRYWARGECWYGYYRGEWVFSPTPDGAARAGWAAWGRALGVLFRQRPL